MNGTDNTSPGEPLITIGLVADLHYAATVVGTRYCEESLTKLRCSVETFQDRRPDAVINLGDSIDTSETLEREIACVHEIRDALAALPVDSHVLLGNHDLEHLSKEQYLAACGAASSYYSFDCRGVHFVILDSNFHSDGSPYAPGNFCWNDAWLGEEQIRWLEDDLAAAAGRPALVFCHANLDDRQNEDGAPSPFVTGDAPAVRAVLEAAGTVKAVVQGHCHSGHQAVINGIPYIILHAMVEGSGPESSTYALLSLMADGEVCLEGFGRQPSMRFEAGDSKPAAS